MSSRPARTAPLADEVAIVIPVFNEAAVIAEVVESVRLWFPRVICVDDGSEDASADEILRSGAQLVRHPINLGQGAALQTGIEYALTDRSVRYIATFDADGQHRVEDLQLMLERLRGGDADIVFGSRFLDERTEMPTLKRVVLRLAVAYTNATSGVSLTDAHNGLRVFTRSVAESLKIRQNGMAHASDIVDQVGRNGFKVAEQPVKILYTDYSKAKGQSLLNSVNILFDLFFR